MAARVTLPNNWRPRPYQLDAWRYLQNGGKRADLCWHRRSGKDEIALHWTACDAIQRPATYWHMLPEAAQARKAIWTAVNKHTGKRRIDEAFPHEIRRRTRDQEMSIELVNGSTWQVVGSDNFNSLVGSNPAGVVFSEWSLANPTAWGFIRPILLENNGWAMRIYTPRGKNHGYRGHEYAKKSADWFAQRLTAAQTGVFTAEQLENEKLELVGEYGETEGLSLFEQEYFCSFDAAILGAVYGAWIAKAEKDGRVGAHVAYDESLPVHTGWDLGYDDLTAIWFFQVAGNELRIVDYYQNNGQDVEHYCQVIADRAYNYEGAKHYVPHDAANKLLAARGRSIVAQARECGVVMSVIAATSVQNSIAAARKTLASTYFADNEHVQVGFDALKQYRYKWDSEQRILSHEPVHDWTSHPADAFEIVARAWRAVKQQEPPKPPEFSASSSGRSGRSVQEIIAANAARRRGEK